jgi:hypothetical protein
MTHYPSDNQGDYAIGRWLEDASRRIGRRKVLLNSLKAAAVTIAGVTVGVMPGGRALAHPEHSYCHYPGAGHCSVLGRSCPSAGGCPSGCYVCTKPSGCGGCIYSSGYWATRSGSCGSQGYGYYLCYDCRCTSCSSVCGCRSACKCGGCRTPADVRQDMQETMAELARQSG